jgi:hypothetical protein
MEFVIWVETRLAGKTLELCPVASVERSASGIEPEELGLTLQDGQDRFEAGSGLATVNVVIHGEVYGQRDPEFSASTRSTSRRVGYLERSPAPL